MLGLKPRYTFDGYFHLLGLHNEKQRLDKDEDEFVADYGQWLLNQYAISEIAYIRDYGIDGGFRGLVSRDDLRKVYELHKSAIWTLLYNSAHDLGFGSVLHYLAENCPDIEIEDDFTSYLVSESLKVLAGQIVNEDKEGQS